MGGSEWIRQPRSLIHSDPRIPRTPPTPAPPLEYGRQRQHQLAGVARRRDRRREPCLRSLLGPARRRGGPDRRRADHRRFQRGERVVRLDPVRGMQPGQRPARRRPRTWPGRRSQRSKHRPRSGGRGRGRRGAAAALRPVPAAPARGRRRRPAGRHRRRPGGTEGPAPRRVHRHRPVPAKGAAVTDAVTLIRTKRDGHRLSDDDIGWLFEAYAKGEVADEQMSALLMAIYFQGLGPGELRTWTAAMIASGDRLDLSAVRKPTVDKHSTGGVGDKVSLILAPLVAACGAAVPQLSGRGLGHTGGTLDKLESIPGFRTALSPAQTIDVLNRAGCVICAAGSGLAPADRRLYALRDVTGTVESIPLIASSIMSKKIAEGTSALVLDVKVGSGAFMKDEQRARELAQTMVALGQEHGVTTRALLTRMDVPLGRAVGNAVEVEESVQALHGQGPDDLMEVTLALAAQMLALVGIDEDPAAAIADGRALAAYRDMVRAQGGDPDASLPRAPHITHALRAPGDGWLTRLDALAVGTAAWRLGAGRARKEDAISAAAGVICLAKPGDRVAMGQPLLELRADDESRFAAALAALDAAVEVSDQPPVPVPLVIEHINS